MKKVTDEMRAMVDEEGDTYADLMREYVDCLLNLGAVGLHEVQVQILQSDLVYLKERLDKHPAILAYNSQQD